MVDTLEFTVIQGPLESLGNLPDLLHERHGLAAGDLYSHLTVPLHQATGARMLADNQVASEPYLCRVETLIV